MDIDLQRVWCPEDMKESPCILCEEHFVVESVAGACPDIDAQYVCPTCIEYFGKRNPEKFPTLEEYEEAKKRYPDPIWGSEEEIKCKDPNWYYINSVLYVNRAELR
jgi:hypothetical protein